MCSQAAERLRILVDKNSDEPWLENKTHTHTRRERERERERNRERLNNEGAAHLIAISNLQMTIVPRLLTRLHKLNGSS